MIFEFEFANYCCPVNLFESFVNISNHYLFKVNQNLTPYVLAIWEYS